MNTRSSLTIICCEPSAVPCHWNNKAVFNLKNEKIFCKNKAEENPLLVFCLLKLFSYIWSEKMVDGPLISFIRTINLHYIQKFFQTFSFVKISCVSTKHLNFDFWFSKKYVRSLVTACQPHWYGAQVLVITHCNMLQSVILVKQCSFFLINKGQLAREVYVAEAKMAILRDQHFAVPTRSWIFI